MPLTVFTCHRVLPNPHPDALNASAFERSLDYMQKKFIMLSPDDALAYITGTQTFPENKRFAMLSFDDGWLDNWLFATPILKRRNLKAALALSAGFLHDGLVRERAEDVPAAVVERRNLDAEKIATSGDTLCYLSRKEVKAMHDSGCWTIEAHGTRHVKNSRGISSIAAPDVGVSNDAFEKFLRADLENCIREISTITHRKPAMLFWPWGHYSDASVRIAKSVGFKAQFTTEKGSVAPRDARDVLPRLNVAPKWEKFTRNVFIFSRPFLTKLHACIAHTETLRKE